MQRHRSLSQFAKGPAGPLVNGDTEAGPHHPLWPPLFRGCCSWLIHTVTDPRDQKEPLKTQTGSTETPPSPAVNLGQMLKGTTQPVLPIGASKWGPLIK